MTTFDKCAIVFLAAFSIAGIAFLPGVLDSTASENTPSTQAVSIGVFRNCDLMRGYDSNRKEYFYFTDCSSDRLRNVHPYSGSTNGMP